MGKSSRHKSENTFRFQSVSERIANINIDVIHQIKHHDDTPEDISTYFWECLEKQTELNCTAHFTNFRKEISQKVKTITQLVHHKDTIVTSLKTHLLIPKSMALPSLLDLVVALARDLQMDFYSHFREFFDILVELLGTYTQDVEVLEQTFTCLSYLFKFLWRYLIKDIESVYEYFSSLLSKKYKEYIRNFAAECFAFLMRKVKDHSGLFDFLFDSLRDQPEKCEGLGRLLFEMMKGVSHQFHSTSIKIFPILLTKLGCLKEKSDVALPWEEVETSFRTLLLSMMKHADNEHIVPMIELFLNALKAQFQQCLSVKGKKNKASASDSLIRFLRLGKCIVDFKGASVITKPDSFGKTLIEFIQERSLPEDVGEPLLAISTSILLKCSSKMEVQVTSRLIASVFKTNYQPEVVYSFVRSIFKLPTFEMYVLPNLLPYCDNHIAMDMPSHDQTLLLVTDLLMQRSPMLQNGSDLANADTYMLDFGPKSKFPGVISSMIKGIQDNRDRNSLIKCWIALVCAPHVRPLKTDGLMKIMADFIASNLSSSEIPDSETCFIMAQVIVAMVLLGEDTTDLYTSISPDLVLECLLKQTENVQYLRFADIYMAYGVELNVQDLLTEERFNQIFPALQDNLSSPNSLIRLLTLRILTNFTLPLPESKNEVQDVLKICLYAETIPAMVQTYRDKLRYLQKLEHADVQKSIPNQTLQQVPLRYLIGCLFINFKLLWKPLLELISSHAYGMEKNAFWEVLGKHLTMAAENCRKADSNDAVLDNSDIQDTDDLLSMFTSSMEETTYSVQTPDFNNFRIQLWKCMHKFPEKCEPKSKVFIPVFFDYLRLEYNPTDMGLAQTQDILKKTSDETRTTPVKRKKRKSSGRTSISQEETTCTDTANNKDTSNTSGDAILPVSNVGMDSENVPKRRYRTRQSSKCEDSDNMEVDHDEESVNTQQTSTGSSNELNSSRKTQKNKSKHKLLEKEQRHFTRSLKKVEEVESESDEDEEEAEIEDAVEDNQSAEPLVEGDDSEEDDDELDESQMFKSGKSGKEK